MLSLLVIVLLLAMVPTILGLLGGRRRGAPERMRRYRVGAVIALVLLGLLSIPFDRWLIATVSCGHQPIETSDFAAANSYTLPSDGTYSRYPIFDGFACNVSDVQGRQHNDLP